MKLRLSKELTSTQRDICKGYVDNFLCAMRNGWIDIVKEDNDDKEGTDQGLSETGC